MTAWTWPAALAAARAHSRRLRRDLRAELALCARRRWPTTQLTPHLETHRRARDIDAPTPNPVTHSMILVDLCHVSRYTAARWLEYGALTDDQADRVAFALGLHPVNVWVDWYNSDEVTA